MKTFIQTRHPDTPDEIWYVEHFPVYTLGQRATFEDIKQPDATPIPIIHTDRGGRVTYHGPGQLVIYPLLNLSRLKCNLRTLVTALESTVIQLLKAYQVNAYAKQAAPGVYIEEAKIASIGLRIRKGCSYHGIAINVDMDLSPFEAIDPCGFKGLAMTQLIDWVGPISLESTFEQFLKYWHQQPLYH